MFSQSDQMRHLVFLTLQKYESYVSGLLQNDDASVKMQSAGLIVTFLLNLKTALPRSQNSLYFCT